RRCNAWNRACEPLSMFSSMSVPVIELRDVTHVYPGGSVALDRISLSIGRGEFAFLVGPTGCGKSTCVRLLMREIEASGGQVLISGHDVGAMPQKKVPRLRRNIGVVFQDFKLLPNRTVYDNVAYSLQLIGVTRAQIRRTVPTVLVATHVRVMVDKMRRRVIELREGRLIRDEHAGLYRPEESTKEFAVRLREELGIGTDPEPRRRDRPPVPTP